MNARAYFFHPSAWFAAFHSFCKGIAKPSNYISLRGIPKGRTHRDIARKPARKKKEDKHTAPSLHCVKSSGLKKKAVACF